MARLSIRLLGAPGAFRKAPLTLRSLGDAQLRACQEDGEDRWVPDLRSARVLRWAGRVVGPFLVIGYGFPPLALARLGEHVRCAVDPWGAASPSIRCARDPGRIWLPAVRPGRPTTCSKINSTQNAPRSLHVFQTMKSVARTIWGGLSGSQRSTREARSYGGVQGLGN